MSLYEEEMEPDDEEDGLMPPNLTQIILPSGRKLDTCAFRECTIFESGGSVSLKVGDATHVFISRHASLEEAELSVIALVQFCENVFKLHAISHIGGCPCCECCQDEG